MLLNVIHTLINIAYYKKHFLYVYTQLSIDYLLISLFVSKQIMHAPNINNINKIFKKYVPIPFIWFRRLKSNGKLYYIRNIIHI